MDRDSAKAEATPETRDAETDGTREVQGSAAGRLSRPQLQALAHLRRCAPTATALSARGRRSGVGFILAAVSGAGGGGGGPPSAGRHSGPTPAGPSRPRGGGWCKRLPWPQPAGTDAAASPDVNSEGVARGWGPYVWPKPVQGGFRALPRLKVDPSLPSADPYQADDWLEYVGCLSTLPYHARGSNRRWKRRREASAAAFARAHTLSAQAMAWMLRLEAEDQSRLAEPLLESAVAAAEADEARLRTVLQQLGVGGDEAAVWTYCNGLDLEGLRGLVEELRPGLARKSVAWDSLLALAEDEACGSAPSDGAAEILCAAVVGLILLHGIPSAALEPWGGEGQGPEPMACAGVALLRSCSQLWCKLRKAPPWAVAAPGLLHFAICHGPIPSTCSGEAPAMRYAPDHVEWLLRQTMCVRGPAYVKEAELMRAVMSTMPVSGDARSASHAVPAATEAELCALARQAALLSWSCLVGGSPETLAAVADRTAEANPSRFMALMCQPWRWNQDEEDWSDGEECDDVSSHAAEPRYAAAGPEAEHLDRCGACPGPASGSTSAPAPSGPRCCLFDALFWPAGRSSGAAACHTPGASSAGAGASAAGVNGAATTPDAPEPWEAELPWLAWLGRQGLLDAPERLLSERQSGHLSYVLSYTERCAQYFATYTRTAAEGARHIAEGEALFAKEEAQTAAKLRQSGSLLPLLVKLTNGSTPLEVLRGTPDRLRPGLEEAHPGTWGRLLPGEELLKGDPGAVEAARMSCIGLACLEGTQYTLADLSLGLCVAAGSAAHARLVGGAACRPMTAAREGAADLVEIWGAALQTGWRLFGWLHELLPLGSLAPQPTWTCAPRANRHGTPGSSSSSNSQPYGQPYSSDAGAAASQRGLADALAHFVCLYPESSQLLMHLFFATRNAYEEACHREAGNASEADQSRREVRERISKLAAIALHTLAPPARERYSQRAVSVAVELCARDGFALYDSSAGTGAVRGAAEEDLSQSPSDSAGGGVAQAAAVGPQMPVYGPSSNEAQRLGALLRVAGSSPVLWAEHTFKPPGPPPPQSVAVDGAAHTSLLLCLLSVLSLAEPGKGNYPNALAFTPVVLPGAGGCARAGVEAGGAAAGISAAPKSKGQPAGGAEGGASRVLLKDIQVGCLPFASGLHKDKYQWDLLLRFMPRLTSASASAKNRAVQVALVLEGLLKRGLGAAWISGVGVEGIHAALLVAAEVRQAMLDVGRDCCVMVPHVEWKTVKELAAEAASQAKPRPERNGATSEASAPEDSDPSARASSALRQLTDTACLCRDLALLARYRGARCAADEHPTDVDTKVGALQKLEAEVLGLLQQEGGPLREGLQVDLRVMECAPGRPGELVFPAVGKQVAAGSCLAKARAERKAGKGGGKGARR
ncbi:hypothetical protein HYH03_007038 [Edaphochlamys debaryana]|uniref:Uncharacterized protein n=1 Tax=Edaphochlamys debaryana TaxID=47281 RepID=A0A835Y9D7_9CHLO|nr:hypothetical protein HYH03_007038 [Edaphochlamys debaryana]|eukprot:KAG2494795.1 hypothetical protein HYH03_007038 [Edaphochlamys debaryana]